MQNVFIKKTVNFYIVQFTLLFLILITFSYFLLNLQENVNASNYGFKELFINYQAGLVRRGLLGEIFWFLNKNFSLSPVVFFSYLFLILYGIQIFLFYKIFKKFYFSIPIFLFIFFSPALILFSFYDINIYFLKDIFIKITILLHAFFLIYFFNKKKNKEYYLNILKLFIIPFLTIVILIHEYQVLFLSIHFLFSLSIIKSKKDISKILKYYSFLLIPILFTIIFIGNQVQYDNLNYILNEKFNITVHSQLAGGFYKALGGFYKWHFFYFTYRDFLNLFFSIFLSIIVFYLLFHILLVKKILKFHSYIQKKYLLFFLPTILCFVLAIDHGRNISLISLHLISFYSILHFDLKKFNYYIKKNKKNFFSKILIIIFIFFYIFMWKLNQMAGFGLQGEPNDIFQSSLFSEVIKFTKFIYAYIDINIISLPNFY